MNDRPNSPLLAELRYTLDVMEERSHLGMDDEVASNLRGILLRRIVQAEDAAANRPREHLLAHDLEFCE